MGDFLQTHLVTLVSLIYFRGPLTWLHFVRKNPESKKCKDAQLGPILKTGCNGGVVFWLMSSPATEEIGVMGREIESRQGIGWYIIFKLARKSDGLRKRLSINLNVTFFDCRNFKFFNDTYVRVQKTCLKYKRNHCTY
jgi:hypothetical protein